MGCAVAKALATAGAPVVVNYVADPPAAERVVDEIRNAGGEAMAIRADVSREDEVQAMFRKMFDAYGTIHLLVNNAGLQKDARYIDMTLHDIGRAAVWLASDASDYVNGTSLYIDGGMTLFPGFSTNG
ncbi:MAG: SDR family oxidoreductase [Candidatus Deferrimicrobiaceae bacterium]